MAPGERDDRVEPTLTEAVPPRLDTQRVDVLGEARQTGSGPRSVPYGVVASLLLHLAPLLLFVEWGSAQPEPPAVIPVQLVLEEPPPPPPPPPAPEPKAPAPSRLASEEMGDPAPPAAAQSEPAPPAPDLVAPPRQELAALIPPLPLEKPEPLPQPPVPKPAVHRPAPQPHRESRPARVPGPEATRDEYLAYLVMLVRRHLDLLPPSAIAGRRGETVLAVLVLGDGTIARIAIARGSGYPDIDARVEQMVAAVRRFPPLPQWYQSPRVELTFRLRFPESLLER